MNQSKKTIRGLSNKYINKWIKKDGGSEYVKLLKLEKERREKNGRQHTSTD